MSVTDRSDILIIRSLGLACAALSAAVMSNPFMVLSSISG
jgi:hypothetical protein